MKLAIIAGDGIGPEVIGQAVRVLDVVLPGVETTEYDLGARRYHATGELLTDEIIEELRGYDAILLGAIGDPSVPSGVLERGLLPGDAAQQFQGLAHRRHQRRGVRRGLHAIRGAHEQRIPEVTPQPRQRDADR